VRQLLQSFAKEPALFQRAGIRLAKSLLAHGAYKPARGLLAQIGTDEAKSLQARLKGNRIGAFTLDGEQTAALRRAFSLTAQRDVWVRFGKIADATRMTAEAELQRGACVPGIAEIVELGVGDDGKPFVAVDARLPRLDLVLTNSSKKVARELLIATAISGLRVLRALGLAGVQLPDAKPERFLLDGRRVLLADFSGATAGAATGRLARELASAVLAYPPVTGSELRRDVGGRVKELLEAEGEVDVAKLVDALRQLQ